MRHLNLLYCKGKRIYKLLRKMCKWQKHFTFFQQTLRGVSTFWAPRTGGYSGAGPRATRPGSGTARPRGCRVPDAPPVRGEVHCVQNTHTGLQRHSAKTWAQDSSFVSCVGDPLNTLIMLGKIKYYTDHFNLSLIFKVWLLETGDHRCGSGLWITLYF